MNSPMVGKVGTKELRSAGAAAGVTMTATLCAASARSVPLVKCVRTSSPTARTSAMADFDQREKSPIVSDSDSLVVVGVVSNGFRRMARA